MPFNIFTLSTEIKDSFDYFICSASFEKRCYLIAENLPSDKIANVAIFINVDYSQYYENHIKKILDCFPGEKRTKEINLDTKDPGNNALKIFDFFDKIENVKSKKILIDITTFTHESILVLLKIISLKELPFENISFAYLNAADYSVNESAIEKKWLSKGIGHIRNVIGYSGFINPLLKNHLIVLVGIEEDRTKTLIDKLEPNSISLGVSKDQSSNSDTVVQINKNNHAKFLQYFQGATSFEFTVTNPMEVFAVLKKEVENHPAENIILAPMNNKISTLGAGLFALYNPNILLCYATALQYNIPGYTIPGNDCYLFKLTKPI